MVAGAYSAMSLPAGVSAAFGTAHHPQVTHETSAGEALSWLDRPRPFPLQQRSLPLQERQIQLLKLQQNANLFFERERGLRLMPSSLGLERVLRCRLETWIRHRLGWRR